MWASEFELECRDLGLDRVGRLWVWTGLRDFDSGPCGTMALWDRALPPGSLGPGMLPSVAGDWSLLVLHNNRARPERKERCCEIF